MWFEEDFVKLGVLTGFLSFLAVTGQKVLVPPFIMLTPYLYFIV